MRIVIAGILGGLAMFFWSAFSHMVLQVDGGIKQIPNEAAVVSNLKQNLADPGFYFLPGMDMTKTPTEAEQAEWSAKYEAGPTAIVIYHPTGQTPMGAAQFGGELTSNILACLFAALVISWIPGGFLLRIITAMLFGVVGWLSINVSQWTWYRFPTSMVTAELFDQVGGWLVAGVAIAIIVKGRSALS